MGKQKNKVSGKQAYEQSKKKSHHGGGGRNDEEDPFSKKASTMKQSEYDDPEISNKKDRKKKKRGGGMKLEDEDFQKMNQQLEPYGLYLKKVTGDGNCQFRSVSDQLFGDQTQYQKIRQGAVEYMINYPDMFSPFVCDEPFEDYCKTMKKDTEWGDNLTLQSISLAFNVNIRVHQLGQPSFDIVNYNQPESKLIQLSYHMGEHYNSVHFMSDSIRELYQRASEGKSSSGEISKKEQIIIQSTGCTDMELIRNTLADFGQDMDSTIDFLCQMQYQESSLASSSSNKKSSKTQSQSSSSVGSSKSHESQTFHPTPSSSFSPIEGNLDLCFDMVMSTIGYESGFDLEMVKDMIIQNNYNTEMVIGILLELGSENNPPPTSSSSIDMGSSSSVSTEDSSQSSSKPKEKKLTKREKKEKKQREKLSKVEAIKHRSVQNNTDFDEDTIKKMEVIKI